MALSIHTPNKAEEADSVLRHLKLIDREAKAAAASLSSNDILNLYFRCIRAATKITQLSGIGLTADVLGPIISAKLGIDWATQSADYANLKNVAMPNFITFVATNQSAICQQELNGDSVKYSALSTELKAQALPLITALSALFES